MCALAEAINLVIEEGMGDREERHRRISSLFCEGLAQIGLEPLVDLRGGHRCSSPLKFPLGIDQAKVRATTSGNNIEIGGGLGEVKGRGGVSV